MDVCIESRPARRRASNLRHLAERLRAADRWPSRAIDACAAILQSAAWFRTQAWSPTRPWRISAECARPRQLKHDPEKWEPVSRLREALNSCLRLRLLLRRAKAGRKRSCANK